MQEMLLSYGWYKYEEGKAGCCGGPRSRWKTYKVSGLTITILINQNLFVARRMGRVILTANGESLEKYLGEIDKA